MGKRILIVDDTSEILVLMRTIFEDEQHTVKVLNNGSETLEAAKTFQPDLIVLDLLMEDKHGLDVLKELTEDSSVRGIAIILYTASVIEANKAQKLIGGDPARYNKVSILLKPFALDTLLKLI